MAAAIAPRRPFRRRVANEDIDEQLEKLGGNPGTYIPAGVNGNKLPLLKGRPVLTVEQCPVVGSVGDLILADLDHYVIVDGGMKYAMSLHVRFDTDQALLRFVMRVDGKPSYVINHRALQLFRQKHPKFDRLVVRLSSVNAKIHHAEASARRAQILRAPSIAEHSLEIFSAIRSAVPATLPAQVRDDVIGKMALEIVEGKLRPADIRRRVREYVTAQYRQFSKFGPVSLDARLFEDGSATLRA